ncbi:putative Interleukin enhancer-binding factor 2 protein, partial [Naja naja]
ATEAVDAADALGPGEALAAGKLWGWWILKCCRAPWPPSGTPAGLKKTPRSPR